MEYKLKLLSGSDRRDENGKIISRTRLYSFGKDKTFRITKVFIAGRCHYRLNQTRLATNIYPAWTIDGDIDWGKDWTWHKAEKEAEKTLNRYFDIVNRFTSMVKDANFKVSMTTLKNLRDHDRNDI